MTELPITFSVVIKAEDGVAVWAAVGVLVAVAVAFGVEDGAAVLATIGVLVLILVAVAVAACVMFGVTGKLPRVGA